jgi:hypothetical protein
MEGATTAGAAGVEVRQEFAAEVERVLVGFVREDVEIDGGEAVFGGVLGRLFPALDGLLTAAVATTGFDTPGVRHVEAGLLRRWTC